MSKPATHWRVLNALYDNRLRFARRFLTRVMHDQNVSPDDLINLDMSDLIYASLDGEEIEVRNAVTVAPKRTLLHLAPKGRTQVAEDPGNRIRLRLDRPLPTDLSALLKGSAFTLDDVVKLQDLGQVKATLSSGDDFALTPDLVVIDMVFLCWVALTPRGREYLPTT
ncbi:hypothetical protein Asp14428_45430 [Actinoplanes sp. NBRC 14428]|nr:hypothetical protein Asp14428_45430 [Actinoplanes sp. NBRC 14428]